MKIATSISAMLLLSLLLPSSASAGSNTTWICINNTTSERKLILVTDIDNYDWEGFKRPDHNWHGTYVEAGASRCEQNDTNNNTVPHFSFIIDGTSQAHEVRMGIREYGEQHYHDQRWSVLVGKNPSWSPLRADPENGPKQGGWEAGGPCPDGRGCKEFNFKIVAVP